MAEGKEGRSRISNTCHAQMTSACVSIHCSFSRGVYPFTVAPLVDH